MEKEILTSEEAAKLLQLSRRSLYKLVREGEIPCKKVLNKWRFARESLKRWVEGGEIRCKEDKGR
ncbi:helix-turn-helix domain-containing protein [bacterium]|nr:helix-turn-helix domain-containing protein [bacterium]